ncbi:HAD-IIIC family phosphatase [Streptomyces sp. G5(2025)]|uniref:HAD-IIIC family phosphatase n=1 Tax=Streptomyces sp. G5(2025) TaxID=3406628 RepID=UPI003C281474
MHTSASDGHGAGVLDRVKCVVWDLDGTLWDGVAIESETGALPAPRAWVLDAIDALAERGVLSSVASRTAPSQLELLLAEPALSKRFVAPQVGWQDKSEALRRIADDLGIAVESLVLVDDNAYERAEVSAMLPVAMTLAPQDVPELLAAISTGDITADARERVARYRTDALRKAAGREFSGTREDFLRSCDMRLSLGPARARDFDRFVELAARTHRLNSSGLAVETDRVRALIAEGAYDLWVAELDDRFGAYGLIGAALVERAADSWRIRLLALSCRVAGRGASLGFLRWLMDRASAAGAAEIQVDSRPTSANVELRLLFRQAGFRVVADHVDKEEGRDGDGDGTLVTLGRPLRGPLPDYPWWLEIVDREKTLNDGTAKS